jgi:tubulin-like protein CetZ
MRILWVGFGQAGGKLANTMMGLNQKHYDAIAVNTEEADLADLDNIPRKVLIGKYKHRGRGVGADIEVAADIAQKAVSQVMDVIDGYNRRFDPEAFWIAAGLGGGTGAGGSPILAKELKEIYNKPVYALALLPSTTDMPPEKEALYLSNALRSFEWWRRYFDNILLVDNQQYEARLDVRETIEQMYERINQDVAKRLTSVLSAGEVRPAPQEVFNSSEIIATLGSDGDVSTIGYKSERIRLKAEFWKGGIEPDSNELERIIRESTDVKALSFPCDITGARNAALITRGRPEHLFTQAIIKGRAYLEERTQVSKVRYGDYPDKTAKSLSATTIVSSINDFSRLDQMRQRVAQLV